MFLSVLELFKIGIGPSSSHTVGPMIAASMFLDEIASNNWPKPVHTHITHLRVSLHGSLAFTGVGHATDKAVIFGLLGFKPSTIDVDKMDDYIKKVYADRTVHPDGHEIYQFDPRVDLIFNRSVVLPGHANGMGFEGLDNDGRVLLRRIYYSIGGGFVIAEDEISRIRHNDNADNISVPYPFNTAQSMLMMAEQSGLAIAEMKRANEEIMMKHDEFDTKLDEIYSTMKACIERGLSREGELPGGLHIRRRAKQLHDSLEEDWKNNSPNPLRVNDYLSVYAIAVSEENAAGGRVVTAPTNGAAGVIPSVLNYYENFYDSADRAGIRRFLLTAAAIGGIIKHNASISGAEVGCQGEVGVASAMAAAGLTAALGGTARQTENAAEIALEHHLGMTCDPVAGLVQVPCIERNALGAVKAVTAASLALHGDGAHFVSLDACIETMRQTGYDMSDRYKETSRGGLAVNVADC